MKCYFRKNAIQRILRLFSILIISLFLFSCRIIGNPTLSKYYPTKFTLLDGTTYEGNTSVISNYIFDFYDNNTRKHKSIKTENVLSATKYFPDETINYIRVINCHKHKESILVEEIEKGKLNLYRYLVIRATTASYSTIDEIWFIKKENEDCNMIPIANDGIINTAFSKDSFIDFCKNYFKDVPEIANKVGLEGYKRKDLRKIIKEYNQTIK